MIEDGLQQRVDRIESHLAIEQLAIRYAIAVDSHDLELLVEQWSPEAWMGRDHGLGRAGVWSTYVPILERLDRSIHMIVGHRIDLVDGEHATGTVYCRAETEISGTWTVQAMAYDDSYARVDGEWGFTKRATRTWYVRPIGDRVRSAGTDGTRRGERR